MSAGLYGLSFICKLAYFCIHVQRRSIRLHPTRKYVDHDQSHLEAFDELDDPSNSEQPQQLLNAQQLVHLHPGRVVIVLLISSARHDVQDGLTGCP